MKRLLVDLLDLAAVLALLARDRLLSDDEVELAARISEVHYEPRGGTKKWGRGVHACAKCGAYSTEPICDICVLIISARSAADA